MNRRSLLLTILILVLFLSGLITRNGTLFLMDIPFIIYLGIGLLMAPDEVEVKCEREVSSVRNAANSPISMSITLENLGASIPRLRLDEPMQNKMRFLNGNIDLDACLPVGEKVEYLYTFKAPRAQFLWETVKITASDPFGLFDKTLELTTSAKTLVLPEYLNIKRFVLHPDSTIRTPGPNLSRLPGSGIDFWGVREYQQGDSLRLIDWRRASRHPQQFFSKAFEQEEMADVGLLLDCRAITDLAFGDDNLFEHSVQAAATLARDFLSMGNRVSLLTLSTKIVRVFPGYGKRQLVQILDQLSACQPAENVSVDLLKYLPKKLFPSRSMIVLVSPLRSEDLDALKRMRSEGYQVLVVSPDTVQFISRTQSATTDLSYAIRLARIERTLLLWKIRQMGVEVINWDVNKPLAAPRHQINTSLNGGIR